MKLRAEVLEWSGKKQAGVIAAFRGPDNPRDDPGGVLKWHITSRIRCILFELEEGERLADGFLVLNGAPTKWIYPGGMYYNPSPMTPEDLGEIQKAWEVEVTPTHWGNHLWAALLATFDHPIWGGLGRDLLELSPWQ